MPQAAAVPALGWAGIGLGGASLLDNMFGSGRDARDMQERGLGIQEDLANAQLPDIQRRTALNQWLEDLYKQRMANPPTPQASLDLDPVLQQFYPDMKLLDNDIFGKLAPDVISKQYLDALSGLGGNTGTGGISQFGSMANALGESRRDEFSSNIENIMWALQQSMAAKQAGASSNPYGSPYMGGDLASAFNNPLLFGGFGR